MGRDLESFLGVSQFPKGTFGSLVVYILKYAEYHKTCNNYNLELWFSIFLILPPFNTILHVIVIPNNKNGFVAIS